MSDGVEKRMDSLEGTVKTSLSELTDAVKMLVMLETEHKATREIQARHSLMLDRLDERMDKAEQVLPRATRFMDKVDKVTTIIVTSLLLAAIVAGLGVAYG